MNVFAQSNECNINSEDCLNGTLLFREDFDKYGDGLNPNSPRLSTEPLPEGRTTYQFYNEDDPNDGQYALAKNTIGGRFEWSIYDDNTSPNDNLTGRFMLVNADYVPGVFYRHQIENLCSGSELYFSVMVANCHINWIERDPNLTFSVLNALTNEEITFYNTGDIPLATKPSDWKRYGFRFILPENVNAIKLEIRNNAAGGSGNDLGIDDIEIRLCVPPVFVDAPETVCLGNTAQLTGNFVNDGTFTEPLAYRWFKKNEQDVWVAINGSNSLTYTISNITEADEGYYRLAVSSIENIDMENCRAMSEPIFLAVDYCDLTIIVLANPPEGGTVTGGGSYAFGEVTTVTAEPSDCYKFINWTKNGVIVSTNASYTFTVIESTTLIANFAIPQILQKVYCD